MKTPQQELEQLRKQPKNTVDWHTTLSICIKHMQRTGRHWHFAGEFVGNTKGGWLSYKGTARISDLATYYPKLCEKANVGRFKVYRLISNKVPKELR